MFRQNHFFFYILYYKAVTFKPYFIDSNHYTIHFWHVVVSYFINTFLHIPPFFSSYCAINLLLPKTMHFSEGSNSHLPLDCGLSGANCQQILRFHGDGLPAQREALCLEEGEMFYCSQFSPLLNSDDSSPHSRQNSAPWDPSAPPLKGTSDTFENQERIKYSVQVFLKDESVRRGWRMEAIPQACTDVFKCCGNMWPATVTQTIWAYFWVWLQSVVLMANSYL